MQNDLISRSALLKELEPKGAMVSGSLYCAGIMSGIMGAIYQTEHAPAVDAVVLPVHVQQIVYADLRPWETTLNVQPFMVTRITVTQNKNGKWAKKFRANWFKDEKTVYAARDFWFDEIGNRVFFTKEEAEAVLGRADDGK